MAKKKQENKGSLTDFFRSDRGVLLMCMMVSLLFWLIVKLSENFRSQTTIPLQFVLPAHMTFASPSPGQLEIDLEGQGWDLLGVRFRNREPLVFEVPQQDELLISNRQLKDRVQNRQSEKIKVLETRPDFVRMNLESRHRKTVPVRPVTNLSFASQYKSAGPIRVRPDSVEIIGPRSDLEALSFWPTEILAMAELREPLTVIQPLVPPENLQISLNPSAVQISVPVEQFTEKIVFIPIKVINATDSLRIYPSQVRVSFSIGLSQYEEVESSHFSASADLENVNVQGGANTAPLTVTCSHPDVSGLLYSPRSVEFYVIQENGGE